MLQNIYKQQVFVFDNVDSTDTGIIS